MMNYPTNDATLRESFLEMERNESRNVIMACRKEEEQARPQASGSLMIHGGKPARCRSSHEIWPLSKYHHDDNALIFFPLLL